MSKPIPVLTPLPAPLLFWQVGLLSVAAGVVAWVHPAAALIAWALGVVADGRARGIRLAFLAVCFGLGLLAAWFCLSGSASPDPDWVGKKLLVRGEVASTRGLPDKRLRVVLRRARPVTGGAALEALTAVTWQYPDQRVLPGQTFEAVMTVRPVRGFLNEDGADFAGYWLLQGVGYTAFLRGDRAPVAVSGEAAAPIRLRAAWRDALGRALDRAGLAEAPGAALIPALLFGDQQTLSSAELERFTRAGLRHSLALSGQHLAVVGLLAFLPVVLLEWLFPAILLLAPHRLLVGVISLPLAALCLWLGNAPPSLIRATLMLLVWVLVQWRARPMTLLDGLCMALACMMLVWPACVLDLGVQLSLLSVAGIALAHPLWRTLIERYRPLSGQRSRCRRRLLACGLGLAWAACLSLAAQAWSLPLVLETFGRATPGLWFNLIWLPVLGLVVLPASWAGMLLLALGWETAAEAALRLAIVPCSWLSGGLAFLENRGWLSASWSLRPHWLSILGYGALLAALAARYGRFSQRSARLLFAAGALLALAGPALRLGNVFDRDVSLYLADVGQGQAVILEWPGGRGLIDGGGFASSRLDAGRDILAPLLLANKPPRLDFVAVSHMDRDHVGGVFFVLEQFDVGLYLAGVSALSEEEPDAVKADHLRMESVLASRGIARRNPVSGEFVPLGGGLRLEVLWPPPGHVLRGNDSLVLRLERDGQGLAVFAGDIEPAGQRALLRLHRDRDISARVLVVPHHGSRHNLEPGFYDAVRPDVALISAGNLRPGVFPSAAVLAALAQRGVPVYTTSEHGGIRVTFSDQDMRMRCTR